MNRNLHNSNALTRFCMTLIMVTFAYSISASAAVPAPLILPETIPDFVRVQVAEAALPIQVTKVDVRAEVVGRVVHTRIEMMLFNPNHQQLEGELQFPLLDGQVVSGFSLDINGELRAAVPVEKEKGQTAFEDIIRTRVDPALLEKTQGNNYKLRIYPLPAQGTRLVVLEIDEVLSSVAEYVVYRLPLQFASTVERLDVSVHNATSPAIHSAVAVRTTMGAARLKVNYEYESKSHSGSQVSFSREKYSEKEVLKVEFPSLVAASIATETRANKTFFYAELPAFAAKKVVRSAPKKMGIVWDASGSGAARDHGREFALLDAYFKGLNNVEVELVLARDRAEAVQSFTIRSGDWHHLRKVLENVPYDGATNSAALSPPSTTDLNLLFSDGLSNFDSGGFVAGARPLFSVNASSSTDLPRLRAWAERNGGRLLDLLSISAIEAVDALTHQSPYLAGMTSNGARELISGSSYGESGTIEVAGILTEPETTIELDWVDGQGQHQPQTIQLNNMAETSLAAQRWAALKLAQLETDYTANRGAIKRLGKQFKMVTRETSLIVLERLEDYVAYEIEPPASLRAEYQRLRAKKISKVNADRNHHIETVATKFKEKVAWWEKRFPKGDKPKPVSQRKPERSPRASRRESVAGEMEAANELSMSERPRDTTSMPMMMAEPSPVAHSNYDAALEQKAGSASIQLKKWQPDSPYASRLRQAAPEKMYVIYLDERPTYTSSTAFFLDAADIFIERGQLELGLRIVSNLAEMNLENRHILRILAYRLLQAKQAKLALPILQRVLSLSENEPQSWRDLGLAYAEDGQYQKAAEHLWEVASRPWDARFPDIELIALNELNAIIANVPQGTSIDTSRMDTRLLRNLPLDIRAVLGWDSDNADIDLWVTDPNGEKVYYQHRLGYQGGSMSSDFTGGYGPEEFSLRTAKPGKYKVEAHFYGNTQQIVSGATTLMLRFSTGFGTDHQKDENVILRLTGQGADVEVGTFEVEEMP